MRLPLPPQTGGQTRQVIEDAWSGEMTVLMASAAVGGVQQGAEGTQGRWNLRTRTRTHTETGRDQ